MDILAEEQKNYTLMSSLEQLALVKTAITLWNPDDIISPRSYFKPEEGKLSGSHVMEKVKELPLPEYLKKKVLCFILPIGIEIHKGINDYLHILSDGTEVRFRSLVRKSLKRLCWTSQGTVDRRKTAEVLIRDENLEIDITKRYKLACINCLKNDIVMLWNKMPEDCKKSFYHKDDPIHVVQDRLVVLWTYDIKEELTRMHHIFKKKWDGCTPYQYGFAYAVFSENKPATEYFLQKLTSEEREVSFERSVLPNKATLCYLLSQMNEVQRVGMFREHPYSVLNCLLDWPLQSLFIETSKHVWDYLPRKYYFYLLRNIIHKVKSFKDYNYQKLFTEFWQLIHATDKKFVLFNHDGALLGHLLSIKDKENIKIVLKDVSALDREKFIFSAKGLELCSPLIYKHEMDLLEFFLQECISSEDPMIKFMEEFKKWSTAMKEIAERRKRKLEETFFNHY